jgi:hypothetical protein
MLVVLSIRTYSLQQFAAKRDILAQQYRTVAHGRGCKECPMMEHLRWNDLDELKNAVRSKPTCAIPSERNSVLTVGLLERSAG